MTASLTDSERRLLRHKAQTAILGALTSLGGDARREAILTRALADGGFSAREMEAAPPERAREKYSRLVDHELSWALTGLRRDGLVEKPAWGVWRLTTAGLPTVAAAVEGALTPGRLEELQAMPYRHYLRTPEWRRTRAAALRRAGGSCSLDVTHTDGLEVHHRTYERLGEELLTDVVVLCHACHWLHHKEHGRQGRGRDPKPLVSTYRAPGHTPEGGGLDARKLPR